MNFIIVLVVCIVLAIAAFKFYEFCPSSIEIATLCVGGFAAVLCILSLAYAIALPIVQPLDTKVYKQQYEWFEQHEPVSDYEDVAITQKKIELNEWLYSAKATMENFPGWHFYPDEVIELEPIK